MAFSVLIEDDGDEFVTYVPVLDFSSTFGATRAEALERTRELIVGYLEAAAIEGIELDVTDCPREIVNLPIIR
jgi:predicted RNase H-like HicB family nuclease